MKKIIATLCAAFISAVCVTGLKAQETAGPEEVTVLQVNLKSGAVDKFRLPDKPTVTFEGDNMVVESEGMQGNYARADVSHFDFGIDKLSAVDTTTMQADDFTLSFTDNANVVINAPRLTAADLFDAAGRKILSVVATDGNAVLKVGHLAPGVYIVAPDCHPAVKIIKR